MGGGLRCCVDSWLAYTALGLIPHHHDAQPHPVTALVTSSIVHGDRPSDTSNLHGSLRVGELPELIMNMLASFSKLTKDETLSFLQQTLNLFFSLINFILGQYYLKIGTITTIFNLINMSPIISYNVLLLNVVGLLIEDGSNQC